MKTILRLCCALCALAFYFHPVQAASTDTNLPPRLTMELRDGSRVTGASVEKYLTFRAALSGEIKLEVKKIRSVECSSTNYAKLTTVNGDSLTVCFVDSVIAMKTSFGKVELPVNSLRKISVSTSRTTGAHPAGLVALWSGEGNADDSVNGSNGILNGGATFAEGKVGRAFKFHNLGDSVTAPAAGLPVGTSDRTIACWVYIESFLPRAEATIAAYGNFGKANQAFAIYFNDQPDHRLCFSTWGDAIVGPVLEKGQWYNIAVTSIGNDSIKLYVNGVLVASGVSQFNTPPDSIFRIGQIAEPDCVRQFIGMIDEVAIYNRALSAEEIQAVCKEENHGELPTPAVQPRMPFNGIYRSGPSFSE